MAQTTVSQMVQQLEQGAEQLLEQYNAVVAERDALQNIVTSMVQPRQSTAPEQILDTLNKIRGVKQQPEAIAMVKYDLRVKKKKVRKKAKTKTRKKRKTKAVATEAKRQT